MRRAVLVAMGAYLLLAVGNKVAEAAGARRCGCADGCWCRRPYVSLFRWVFPWRHQGHQDKELGEGVSEEP